MGCVMDEGITIISESEFYNDSLSEESSQADDLQISPYVDTGSSQDSITIEGIESITPTSDTSSPATASSPTGDNVSTTSDNDTSNDVIITSSNNGTGNTDYSCIFTEEDRQQILSSLDTVQTFLTDEQTARETSEETWGNPSEMLSSLLLSQQEEVQLLQTIAKNQQTIYSAIRVSNTFSCLLVFVTLVICGIGFARSAWDRFF